MSLTKPILYSMVAFDATNGAEFTFNAIGGSQVVANELVITNQVTSEIAYQEVQNTFVFSHALSGDILENGEYYSAVIYTYDAENNKSIASNAIQFFCFSAPTFALTNIPESGIIANSSLLLLWNIIKLRMKDFPVILLIFMMHSKQEWQQVELNMLVEISRQTAYNILFLA